MCEQPDDGCHGTTYEMASLCLLLNSFSFLGARAGHTKNRHTTLQPWSVSPVAPCSPGGQVGIGANRKGQLPYILIPICRSLFQTADHCTHGSSGSPLARASTV